jgi:hypothetical protein
LANFLLSFLNACYIYKLYTKHFECCWHSVNITCHGLPNCAHVLCDRTLSNTCSTWCKNTDPRVSSRHFLAYAISHICNFFKSKKSLK